MFNPLPQQLIQWNQTRPSVSFTSDGVCWYSTRLLSCLFCCHGNISIYKAFIWVIVDRDVCLLNGVLLKSLFQAGVRFRNIRHFHLVISSDARHSGRKTAGLLFCHTKEEQKRDKRRSQLPFWDFTILICRYSFQTRITFSSLKQKGFYQNDRLSSYSFTITAYFSVQYNEWRLILSAW